MSNNKSSSGNSNPEPSDSESVLEEIVPYSDVASLIDSIGSWINAELLNLAVALQLGLIVIAVLPAFFFGPTLKKAINSFFHERFDQKTVRRLSYALSTLATPLILYIVLTAMIVGLSSLGRPYSWLSGVMALLNAWIVVRLVTLVIDSKFWSRVAFYLAWPIAALDAFGYLGPVVEQMQALAIPLGENQAGQSIEVSLFDVLRTLVYFAILFWGAKLLSNLFQARIENIDELSPSLKALLIKILNFVMPVLALLVAFQIVGFNFAALAVFSGAVGLGVGLGLQRIVANFVAGFTLIADKSIKPQDVIEIDGTVGSVTAMQSRYVALRTRDGAEHLIPNDRFMSEGVVNWSRSDRIIRLHAAFGVSYKTKDLELVQQIAVEAAQAVNRVIQNPKPVCNLVAFGDSSVDFDLRFWIRDPQLGIANVRSDVFLGLWKRLHEQQIEIPYPQRDVHIIEDASE